MELDANCELILEDLTGQVNVTENCSAYTIEQLPAVGTVITGVGVTPIQMIVTDAAGNSSSCSFNLSTIDITAPVIVCSPDTTISVECGPADVTLTPPVATDCGGSVTITSDYSGNSFPVGSTQVTWTATDQYGNSSSCVQVVHVISPEIDVFGNGFEIATRTRNTSFSSGTNFGNVSECNASVTNTFVIENNGTDTLFLTGLPIIQVVGVHAQNYSVVQPNESFILPGDQLSFDVTFDPVSPGNKIARIRIGNNDCNDHHMSSR